MDGNRLVSLLGRDPETSLGYLFGCAVLSPVMAGVFEANVAHEVSDLLPPSLGPFPLLVLHGALLSGVAAATGYHAAANDGPVTGYVGAVVALYGAAFAVTPLNVGGGFPGQLTVYERAGQALVVALAVGAAIATAGIVAGSTARRLRRTPTGRPLATLGRLVAGPIPRDATHGVVAVALLLVVSAGSLAAAAPQYGHHGPCVDPPSVPDVDVARLGGTFDLRYEHGCGLPARSFRIEVDGERTTWADRDPKLGPEETITRGRTLTVDVPPNGTVVLRYERPGHSDGSVLGYWNTSDGGGERSLELAW